MAKLFLCFAAGLACLVVGCQTSDDPRGGGLFSYNPAMYEKRLEEREQRLKELQAREIELKRTFDQLEGEHAQKHRERDALKHKIDLLEEDVGRLEKLIKASRAKGGEQERQFSKFEAETGLLKAELEDIKKMRAGNLDEKENQVEILEKTIDALLLEAEELSRM
ncbi:MAG: hypothetical protein R6U13_16305 [Desulfatiglandaceae bacterium]